MQMSECAVLITGAGPTGLTLACTLARAGVSVRIVDASAAPPIGSRGKGLQPRSLELFDDLGIVERVLANGMFNLPVCHYDESGIPKIEQLHEQRASRPDAPYTASLVIPQWRIEEALREKLESLGVRVEFGMELTALAQDSTGVTAELSVSGRKISVRTQWLVGCDGGKSIVRHLVGISFLGETLESYRMLVADVRASAIDRDHWHIWRSAEGFMALCPLPSTDVFQYQASVAPGQESEASLDVLQRTLEQRTDRSDIRLSNATWISLWRANIRMVDKYRDGRIFLAGDAAHVHSPAGGQGMNTGIQDAYNLGWKLAAVVAGADESLLDTYQQERLPIAAWVLGISNRLLAVTVATRTIAFNRDDQTLQLGLNYRESVLSRDTRPDGPGLRAGDRAPDALRLIGPTGPCRVFDLLRGPHATLLGFGAQWQQLIENRVAASRGQLRGYVIVDRSTNPAHYSDRDGNAHAAYAQDTLFVVRPDNYVGLATREVDESALTDYLRVRLLHGRQASPAGTFLV
jgi:2-polyprenyl-6-methoxyphenol hydroxylase-like FAD-dependent oxidoreductase